MSFAHADAAAVVWLGGGETQVGLDPVFTRDLLRLLEQEPLLRGRMEFIEMSLLRSRLREVELEPFGIDRNEVSQAQYGACVADGECSPLHFQTERPDFAANELPAVLVTIHEASRYCAFAGGRLPTEAEWEYAARGPFTRLFPWGNVWNPALANHGKRLHDPDESDGFLYLAHAGAFPDGASPFGLYDMAGNVMEWVETDASANDDLGRPVGGAVAKGGSWQSTGFFLAVAQAAVLNPAHSYPDVGFRCAYDAKPDE